MGHAYIQQDPLHKNTENDRMRNHISFSVSFLISALFTVFGIVNLIIGKTYAGLFETGAGIIILTVNILVFRYRKSNIIPSITLNFITVLLSLYLYWNGGFGHTGIFWCLAFPGLFVSTRGIKRGIFWISLHLSLLGTLYILSRSGFICIAYNGLESLAALIVYGFNCFIIFSYEISRSIYQKEIRRLNEHLPICSFCKRIRDKNGRWHPIESYLNREADIDFSHGICPDCLDHHYPEYRDERKK